MMLMPDAKSCSPSLSRRKLVLRAMAAPLAAAATCPSMEPETRGSNTTGTRRVDTLRGLRRLTARSPADRGEPTLRQQEERRDRDMRNAVEQHPLVQAVFETFPGATIAAVRERFLPAGSAADDPPPELDPADETISEEDGT